MVRCAWRLLVGRLSVHYLYFFFESLFLDWQEGLALQRPKVISEHLLMKNIYLFLQRTQTLSRVFGCQSCWRQRKKTQLNGGIINKWTNQDCGVELAHGLRCMLIAACQNEDKRQRVLDLQSSLFFYLTPDLVFWKWSIQYFIYRLTHSWQQCRYNCWNSRGTLSNTSLILEWQWKFSAMQCPMAWVGFCLKLIAESDWNLVAVCELKHNRA